MSQKGKQKSDDQEERLQKGTGKCNDEWKKQPEEKIDKRLQKEIKKIRHLVEAALFASIVVLLGLVISSQFSSEKPTLETLLDKYSDLDEDNRAQLSAAAKKWLGGDDRPTIITISGDKADELAEDLIVALCHNRSRGISFQIFGQKWLSHQKFKKIDAEGIDNGKQITALLEEGFQSQLPALVSRIEELKWDAPLFIFNYADYDNILHKNILLVITVNYRYTGKCSRELNSYLTEKWTSSGGTNQFIEPIVSRILRYYICL